MHLKGELCLCQEQNQASCSHAGFASAWRLSQVHVRCYFTSEKCTGLSCAQRLCWKGTAGCSKDILRLCPAVPDFQAEQLVYVMYTDCSVGSAGIWTSPSYAFFSPCCLCPAECGIKVRLFIDPVWICKSSSNPLHFSPFFFWRFEWKILNESFSIETTAFISWFSHRAYSHESWKKPLFYGYICLCFTMYTCTFYACYQTPAVYCLFRWKGLVFIVKLVIRAPVQGHVMYWEGESSHKIWSEKLSSSQEDKKMQGHGKVLQDR